MIFFFSKISLFLALFKLDEICDDIYQLTELFFLIPHFFRAKKNQLKGLLENNY